MLLRIPPFQRFSSQETPTERTRHCFDEQAVGVLMHRVRSSSVYGDAHNRGPCSAGDVEAVRLSALAHQGARRLPCLIYVLHQQRALDVPAGS